jgi:hypothetical protein
MMLHMTWPNPYKLPEWHQQIWPSHLMKISAVNCKQLSNDIIDPLFLWYLSVGRSRRSWPQWAKYSNLSVRSFVTSKKSILEFNPLQKWYSRWVTFLLALITLWAHAYPQDMLTTCCCLPHLPGARQGRQG